VRPKVSETTALGAAYLAGLAVGFWKNQSEIATQWQTDRRFVPSMKAPARKLLAEGWAKALGRAKNWVS
jgi:glycerol kinase